MNYANVILKSNAVFTGAERGVFKGGVAVKDDKIISVGSYEQIEEFIGEKTKIYEYGDNLIMPGFIDCHMHLFFGAMFGSKNYLDLSDSTSEKDCISKLKEFLAENPDVDHVTGWGWFIMNWEDKKTPTKASLDKVSMDIPIYMFCVDGHTCWLNSKALEVCGFTKDSQVSFGSIGKDENGELNGLLYEIEAESPAMEKGFFVADDEWVSVRDKLFKKISSYGITSIADLAASPTIEEEPSGYERLLDYRKSGNQSVRIHLYPSLGIKPDFTIANTLKKKYNYDDLRVSGLKQFVDGTTSLHSGYMLSDYEDKPGVTGGPNYPHEFYVRMITEANKQGFDVRLHAIGDGAVRVALDSFEQSGKVNDLSNIRNSVEHCESIDPSDIPRFAKTGAIASLQPTHHILDANEKVERIGKKRARYEWPNRSLLDAGAVLAFSTDYPVYDFNPMAGIYAAVTRADEYGIPIGASEEEKITVKEALLAYTKGSAYSLNRDKELGTLEAGKLADIIVLSGNPFDVDVKELLTIHTILTMMNGKIVHER